VADEGRLAESPRPKREAPRLVRGASSSGAASVIDGNFDFINSTIGKCLLTPVADRRKLLSFPQVRISGG